MFFQLLFIHLFRPFLKYNQATSPLPQAVSPRRLCTQAAAMISKLMRLYKRSHGLRQICNIAVYMVHSACTIHLLNLPDRNARRDIVHGVKHLEEVAEGWLGARRTLGILSVIARRWNVELPEEAAAVFIRTDAKWGPHSTDSSSPVLSQQRRPSTIMLDQARANMQQQQQQQQQVWSHQQNSTNTMLPPGGSNYFNSHGFAEAPRPGGSYTLPPQSAGEMRAPSYPSAHSTPHSGRPPQKSTDSAPTTAGASPSDMFGGVDQLLRDSQDWVYRDQAQLATGFENWGGMDMAGAGLGQSPVNTTGNGTYPTNGYSNNIGMGSTGVNGANGAGLQGMSQTSPFGSLAAYDEQEWYR